MDLYIGFIWLFGGNFAPRGNFLCNGQLLSINQNSAFFSILGTTYGGDGVQTFALPNLQGRTAIGSGNGPGLTPKVLGQVSGTEAVTLTNSNLPIHNHPATLSGATSTPQAAAVAGDATSPENNYLALSPKIGSGPNATVLKTYATPTAATAVAENIKPMVSNPVTGTPTIGVAGSSAAVSIMQPYLALTYCILAQGIYPSRN